MTNNKQNNVLDNARVVSLLSNDVAYCQMQTKQNNYQIIVVNGVPYEYRIFCSLMISRMGGDIPTKLRMQINIQILEFWKDIGYAPEGGVEKYFKLGSWQILIEFTNAIKTVMGSTEDGFESTDYLTMMQKVSQLMKSEKQLRLGDVNYNSWIT